ncbi:Putative protein of unknown function [Podospora comata]|uniref:Uncharacterized protein n=1 Tax=Podospora comata TaxID=48703 RepID=A0ABY6SJY7_PODCO|nr:Putative protein of unknown function [Podospora comata]
MGIALTSDTPLCAFTSFFSLDPSSGSASSHTATRIQPESKEECHIRDPAVVTSAVVPHVPKLQWSHIPKRSL